MRKVVIIYGPTAVGKSAIGIELAKMINGEIISADSMQIYKGLNIGTAKVTNNEMQGIKHHLIDIKMPQEDYSVSEFCSLASNLIEQIIEKGKTPIIVGGTGLYIKSLIDGYTFGGVSKNEAFRSSLETLSNEQIYNKIVGIAPDLCVDKDNRHRLIRALEILTFGNMPQKNAENGLKYPYKLFVISDDREKIYSRINQRVDKMVDMGILDEAKNLLELNLPEDNLCKKAIGYKELFPYVKNKDTLENCLEVLKQKTRNYAKRQFTFINQFKEKEIVTFCGVTETANKIKEILGE